MEADQNDDVTQLLEKWNQGDKSALDQLIPLVYGELRRLAGGYLRRERPDHTLQPTALINEAYLRLVDQRKVDWQNRAQFIGVAARLMRRVLVDHARVHRAAKRGGGEQKLSISENDQPTGGADIELLALHEALEEIAVVDPQQRQIVELRFFGGLMIEEWAAMEATPTS